MARARASPMPGTIRSSSAVAEFTGSLPVHRSLSTPALAASRGTVQEPSPKAAARGPELARRTSRRTAAANAAPTSATMAMFLTGSTRMAVHRRPRPGSFPRLGNPGAIAYP
jgi:hypothetical protein